MRQTAVILTVLSGLCFLPACFPLYYILVENKLSWPEAQQYCRQKYTDLAAVHNQEDLANLNALTEGKDVWIGLQPDPESWKWSLEDQDYYGEGEADFRMWAERQPDNGQQYFKLCVATHRNGKWTDDGCSFHLNFLCYDKNANEQIIFIDQRRNWDEAQRYCRQHHTDLASIRNQAENERLQDVVPSEAWIGLYKDEWKWSDGSALSFSNWAPYHPVGHDPRSCATSVSGQWFNEFCSAQKYFVCYGAVTQTRKLKVVLSQSDRSVNMEELQEGIFEEFNRRVKKLGLSGVKLRWVKQSDGKIFHKREEEEEEEEDKKSCGHK